MNVKVENLPQSQAVVTVDVEPERVAAAREEAFRRISREAVVPGFRKGKAPRNLVERYVRPEAVQDDADAIVMDKAWDELRQGELKDLKLYDVPRVAVKQHNPFVFEMTVTLQPSVVLGDYKNVRVAPELVAVSDADVSEMIEKMRQEQAQWMPVEHRPVRAGDMVTVQGHGTVGERPVVVPQNYTVTIEESSGFLVPGFAMRMVDMEAGKEKEFAFEVPSDSSDKNVAGATGTAFITIQEIKEKVTPVLDDELATTLGSTNVEALKEKVRSSMLTSRENDARIRLESKILDEIANVSTVSFPAVMTDRQVDNMMAERAAYLKQQGIEMDLYLRIARTTIPQMKAEIRPEAERRIRNFLLVEELGRAEGILVEDNSVEAEIDRLVATQQDPEAARKELSSNTVHDDLKDRLFVRQLMENLVKIATEGQTPVAPAATTPEPSASDVVTAEDEKKEAEPEKPKLNIATH